MIWLWAVPVFAGALYLAYKHKVRLLNAMTPTDGFIRHRDLAYGDQPRQMLDMYIPKQTESAVDLPVILFVHGGSWDKGSKDDYVFLADTLTEAGYITVIINYRLAPEHVYPDYVTDTAKAIAWTHRHVTDYGGDTDRLFVMGHSAGAFNVIAAVNTPTFFEKEQLPINAVKAVIGVAGPYSYDFRTDPTYYAFPEQVHPDEIMPDRLVRSNPMPHLLLTAENDTLVEHFNTHDMAAALRAKGAEVEVVQVQGVNHVNVIAAFSRRLTKIADTKQIVLDYLNRH